MTNKLKKRNIWIVQLVRYISALIALRYDTSRLSKFSPFSEQNGSFFTSSGWTTICELNGCSLSILKCFRIFLIYVVENAQSIGREIFFFPKSFISNSFVKYFTVSMSFSRVPTMFKSSTYTTIISNLVCDFLIKMYEHIGLFTYPFFSKYTLRQLYHMCMDCFNPHKNNCYLIEYMLRCFLLLA